MPGFRGSSWTSGDARQPSPWQPTRFDEVNQGVNDAIKSAAAAQTAAERAMQSSLAAETAAGQALQTVQDLTRSLPDMVTKQVKAIDIEPIARRAADLIRAQPSGAPSPKAFDALARLAQLRDVWLDTHDPSLKSAQARLDQERAAMQPILEQLRKSHSALAPGFERQFRALELSAKASADDFKAACLTRLGELIDHERQLIEALR